MEVDSAGFWVVDAEMGGAVCACIGDLNVVARHDGRGVVLGGW